MNSNWCWFSVVSKSSINLKNFFIYLNWFCSKDVMNHWKVSIVTYTLTTLCWHVCQSMIYCVMVLHCNLLFEFQWRGKNHIKKHTYTHISISFYKIFVYLIVIKNLKISALPVALPESLLLNEDICQTWSSNGFQETD